MKMKNIIGASAIVAAFGIIGVTQMSSPPPPPIQHTVKYRKITGTYPNGIINLFVTPGDTLHLVGTFTYLYWGGRGGNSTNRVYIDADSATFKWSGVNGQGVGFNFEDCNYWKIMNANIHNGFTGTAISITGKSNHFELSNITVDSAVYAVWFKDEPQQHPCDSSYWYGHNTMDDLYMHDCDFKNINQDVCYVGSTDQKADRDLVCNGVHYHPLPAQVSNIRIARIRIRNANRSGIQVSGAIGTNYIDSCNIADMGNEQNPNQGTGITFGGNTQNIRAHYDTIKSTFNYNLFSQASGVVSVQYCIFDSSGYSYKYKNVQQIPSTNFTSYKYPTTYLVENNFIGVNSSNPFTNVAIYAQSANMTSSSIFCNTGKVYNLGQSFPYTTVCDTVIASDTIYQTVHVTHDTIEPKHYKDSTYVLDSITGRDTVIHFLDRRKKGGYLHINSTRTWYHYNVREWDSTFLCHNCASHDSIIIVITYQQASYGGMFEHTTTSQKLASANTLGVNLVRSLVSFYAWNGTNSPTSDSLTSNGLSNILNVNAIPTGGANYSSIDTAQFATDIDILCHHANPAKVSLVVFNEMGNLNYYNITTPTDMLPYIYCSKIACRVGHQYGFKVIDGGLTPTALVYWTYRQMSMAGDADTTNFLHYCVPISYQSNCVNRNGTTINAQIANTDYLLTQFVSVPFDYNNLHLYMPFVKFFVDTATNYSTSYTGLNKIVQYLRLHTSKPLITNEFGIVDSAYTSAAILSLKTNMFNKIIYYNDNTQSLIFPVVNSSQTLTPFGTYYKTQSN